MLKPYSAFSLGRLSANWKAQTPAAICGSADPTSAEVGLPSKTRGRQEPYTTYYNTCSIHNGALLYVIQARGLRGWISREPWQRMLLWR